MSATQILALTLVTTLFSTLAPLHSAPSSHLEITVERADWGKAVPIDIAKVSKSAADQIWVWCPQSRLDGIRIYRRFDLPQTDFLRASDGRIAIGLAAEHQRWSQFAFQFAHEFCHALAQQSEAALRGVQTKNSLNLWLEESLCETASLFALRSMAVKWQTKPPYKNWRNYAPLHATYADERLADPQNQLPQGKSFSTWFDEEENSLRSHPCQRHKNVIVATQLLPLFEAEPQHWEAVTFLNQSPQNKNPTLARKLAQWQSDSPPEHRPFIAKIAKRFGINLPPKNPK